MMTALENPLLVVDDHVDTASLLLRAAKRRGLDGDAVYSGHAALRRIELAHPRVVVLDEMMPDMAGLDVLRAIRANPLLADTKVIFYSASYDWEKQRDAYALGVLKWFVKGVDGIDKLMSQVESALRP